MAWTKFDHVRDRFHRPIPQSQRTFVATLIDDAEDELAGKVDDLAGRIVSGEVPIERVRKVVAYAVIDVLRNPEGYTSENRVRGPFTQGGTRAADTVTTRIRFREADLDQLRPAPTPPVTSVQMHLPRWRRL